MLRLVRLVAGPSRAPMRAVEPRVRLGVQSLVLLAALSACAPTTGSGKLEFDAFAAGPESLPASGNYEFTTDSGYTVSLRRASLRIGAVYLNSQVPLPGAAARKCILPGIYVGEVTSGLTVDLLSLALQPFGARGNALADRAFTGEVWLLGDGTEIDAPEDPTVIFDAEGTAERGDESWPFEASLTIGSNRRVAPTDPKQPGENPICGERIVSPIPVDLKPEAGGQLVLRVDPAAFFRLVEFDQLDQVGDSSGKYRFRDETDGQPNINLYRGLHSTRRAYSFTWE